MLGCFFFFRRIVQASVVIMNSGKIISDGNSGTLAFGGNSRGVARALLFKPFFNHDGGCS